MDSAVEIVTRSDVSRMERIQNAANAECVSGCHELWVRLATKTLINNKIHEFVFAAALRDLLQKGRGKHRNILLIGDTNCAKMFILDPLSR